MRRFAVLIFTFALLLLLSALAGANGSPPQAQGNWVTLMSENFEGEFPHGLWHIGRTGDPYLWGKRNCNPHEGIYSMWGGGGGTLGSQTPCSGMYTTGYATTLSYGPFDLSGCTDVRVNFAHWTQLGAGDFLRVGWTYGGSDSFDMLPLQGNFVSTCGGWCEQSFAKVDYKKQLCGQPKVYLVFQFASDYAGGVSYGTFVDDVSVQAYYESVPALDERVYLPLVRR